MHACRPHIRTLCISAYSRQGVGKRAYSPQVRIFADVLHIHAYSSLMRIYAANTHIRRHHAYPRIFVTNAHIHRHCAYASLARIRTDTPHTRTPAMYAHTRRHAAHSRTCSTLAWKHARFRAAFPSLLTQHFDLSFSHKCFPEPVNTAERAAFPSQLIQQFRLVVFARFAQVFSRAC